jgi:hypothetical protein
MHRLSVSAATVLLLALALTGCSLFGPQVFGYPSVDRPLAKDEWEADWEPLEEVYPPDMASGAEVLFVDLGEGIGSMEGEVRMVRMTAADGSVVVDHRLPQGGPPVHHTLAPGSYEVEGYYRVCDGNCGFLDPPEPICSTEVDLRADQGYLVEIGVASGCVVTED